jgi:PAS domain S-box-containing protein
MLDDKEKFNFLDTGEVIFPSDYLIISETDSRGNISYVNKNFCDIAGYTEEEVMGKPHNIVRHPDMPKAAFKIVWDSIEKKGFWNGYVKNLRKDGGFYWVYATILKKVNELGKISYLSIRTKPKRDDILSAEQLYQTLK